MILKLYNRRGISVNNGKTGLPNKITSSGHVWVEFATQTNPKEYI